jgi:segregation and condensation protein B
MDLQSKIEALLFFKAEPTTVSDLTRMLNTSTEEVSEALKALERTLSGRGIRLMRKEDTVMFATAGELAPLIEGIIKEDLEKDLGKAGVETLTIVLYRGPVTRAQIDYIRGVNSTYILRHLLVRGLIEKIPNPDDRRSYLYRPTFDLLRYLGLAKVEDLPEYAAVRAEMDAFEKRQEAAEASATPTS